MATFLEIQNSLLTEFPGFPRPILRRCIAEAYQELSRRWQWSAFVRTLGFSTLAPYNTGTVSLTKGSAVVTGTGTAWTTDMTGGVLLINSYAPYTIKSVESGTALTLAMNWVGNSLPSVSYVIRKDLYPVSTDQSVIVTEVLGVNVDGTALREISGAQLTKASVYSSRPYFWCNAGTLTPYTRYIQLYPIPDAEYPVMVRCRIQPPSLNSDTDEPLLDSALIEIFAWLKILPKALRLLNDQTLTGLYAEKKQQAEQLLEDCMLEDFRRASTQDTIVYDAGAHRPLEAYVPDLED